MTVSYVSRRSLTMYLPGTAPCCIWPSRFLRGDPVSVADTTYFLGKMTVVYGRCFFSGEGVLGRSGPAKLPVFLGEYCRTECVDMLASKRS